MVNRACECGPPDDGEVTLWCQRHRVAKTGGQRHICAGISCPVAKTAQFWGAWERGEMSGQELGGPPDPKPPDFDNAVEAPEHNAAAISDAFGCVHRSHAPIAEVTCELCGSRGEQRPVYQCGLFNEPCTIARYKHGRQQERVCKTCGDRTEPPPDEAAGELLSKEDLRRRDELLRFAASPHGYPSAFCGRGIVIGGGGETFFACAWVCISELRRLGCELPVEIWHLGRHEFDPEMEAAAHSLPGVRVVDASTFRGDLDGWPLKVFATIHSRFREVLYLDADNIPARDPTCLFETPEYRTTGAVFWPDFETCPPRKWALIDMPWRDEPDVESGQVLVDKSRHWKALQIAWFLNEHADYYYQQFYGDKTSWHLGWRLARSPYAMPRRRQIWKYPAIIQYGFDGKPMFWHCHGGKHLLSAGRRIRVISYPRAAVAAQASLRKFWSGQIYAWEAMNPSEQAAAYGSAADYTLDAGESSRVISLKLGGGVEGGGESERRWCVRLLDGDFHLILVGQAHKRQSIAMSMLAWNGREFRGRWNYHDRREISLRLHRESLAVAREPQRSDP